MFRGFVYWDRSFPTSEIMRYHDIYRKTPPDKLYDSFSSFPRIENPVHFAIPGMLVLRAFLFRTSFAFCRPEKGASELSEDILSRQLLVEMGRLHDLIVRYARGGPLSKRRARRPGGSCTGEAGNAANSGMRLRGIAFRTVRFGRRNEIRLSRKHTCGSSAPVRRIRRRRAMSGVIFEKQLREMIAELKKRGLQEPAEIQAALVLTDRILRALCPEVPDRSRRPRGRE